MMPQEATGAAGNNYALFGDVAQLVTISPESIVSRTLYADDQVKAVLFGFDAGQELSEHTASMPAIIHVVQGEADLTLGVDSHTAGAGTWVHMPANLAHSIRARTPVIMLLLLLKTPRP